jgi:hypothetical protein
MNVFMAHGFMAIMAYGSTVVDMEFIDGQRQSVNSVGNSSTDRDNRSTQWGIRRRTETIGQLSGEFVDGQTIGQPTGEFIDGQTIIGQVTGTVIDGQVRFHFDPPK